MYAVPGPDTGDVDRHAAVRERLRRHDQLRQRRQLALPEGDDRRHRRRPERAARQLPERLGLDRPQDRPPARPAGYRQGPARRARDASSRRREVRRPDADPVRLAGRHHPRDDRRRPQPRPAANRSRCEPPALGWYVRRLRRMSPTELVWRTRDAGRRTAWAYAAGHGPGRTPAGHAAAAARSRPSPYDAPAGTACRRTGEARKAVIATADEILAGNSRCSASTARICDAPDWFRDPVTGRRSDPAQYAFRLNHRNEERGRQHQAGLGAVPAPPPHPAGRGVVPDARRRYAERVADQLNDWWRQNPFLSGVHWTSGIEIGTPADQLDLDPPPAGRLARDQRPVRAQRTRASGRSTGTSAISPRSEPRLLGQQPRDRRSRRATRRRPARFPGSPRAPSGAQTPRPCWNANSTPTPSRPASTASWPPTTTASSPSSACTPLLEADARRSSAVSPQTWALLTRTVDVAAAIVDETLRPPRQGDDDEGRRSSSTPRI